VDPSSVVLAVVEAGKQQQIRLRHDVEPGMRTHFTFELKTFQRAGDYSLQFFLMSPSEGAIAEEHGYA
jgi:hypothetical protein